MQNKPTLTEDQLNEKLASSPAPRVTQSQIEDRISDVSFTRLNTTVTIATILLNNGYSVRGESACVNPENYNKEIGEKIAYDNAYRKLWPLFGFLLAEDQFRNTAFINNSASSDPAPDQAQSKEAA